MKKNAARKTIYHVNSKHWEVSISSHLYLLKVPWQHCT